MCGLSKKEIITKNIDGLISYNVLNIKKIKKSITKPSIDLNKSLKTYAK